MRSRSTCDIKTGSSIPTIILVSISDEKPLHMRHAKAGCNDEGGIVSISDEKPLHMRRRHNTTPGLANMVSISDEKPLHMRHWDRLHAKYGNLKFQSQMRSRSTCDEQTGAQNNDIHDVSIS